MSDSVKRIFKIEKRSLILNNDEFLNSHNPNEEDQKQDDSISTHSNLVNQHEEQDILQSNLF